MRFLSRVQPKDFITLCGVLGTEDWLEHELFSSSGRRSRNFDAFCAALEGELGKRGRDDWIEIFLEAGLAVSKVNTIQVRKRRLFAMPILY